MTLCRPANTDIHMKTWQKSWRSGAFLRDKREEVKSAPSCCSLGGWLGGMQAMVSPRIQWVPRPTNTPCVTFRLVVDSHPLFPSHVASGRCVLSAAAAGAPAGVISAFAEPSGWCAGAVLDVGDVPFVRQRRPVVGALGLCRLLRGSLDCFCCPHPSVLRPSTICLVAFPCFPPPPNPTPSPSHKFSKNIKF